MARNGIELCKMGFCASPHLAPGPVAAKPCRFLTNNFILSLLLRITEGNCGYCTSWLRAGRQMKARGFASPSAQAASFGSPRDEGSSFSPPRGSAFGEPPKAPRRHGLVLLSVAGYFDGERGRCWFYIGSQKCRSCCSTLRHVG